MSRIAIFGGSFDPPHHGHIHVAVSLQERHNIDSVYIIPSYKTPWKESYYSPQKRLLMASLAFDTVPHCKVLDTEISRMSDSYTIDTVHALMKNDPEFASAQRFLLLGSDVLPTLHLWKDYQELFTLVTPLIAARSSDIPSSPNLSAQVAQLVSQGWTNTGLLDISSTMIRERSLHNKYNNHLLPKAVSEFMREDR